MWTGSTVLYLSISVVLKERHAIVAAVAGMLWRCWTSRGVIKLGELKGLKTWVPWTRAAGLRERQAMAAAFAQHPGRVLWRLSKSEVSDEDALAALSLGNNTKARWPYCIPELCTAMPSCRADILYAQCIATGLCFSCTRGASRMVADHYFQWHITTP